MQKIRQILLFLERSFSQRSIERETGKYVNLVRENLIRIRNEEGLEGYKKKWSKHDFPSDEYELLKG
ncbi:hypothetical protein [Sphingobacterium athyrii]|nr:hypothetical protein [Sphingobacterium athyrii]